MRIRIFPLLSGPKGRGPGEAEVAQVRLGAGTVHVDCADGALRQLIEEIFARPLLERVPTGERGVAMGHEMVEIPPATPAFFKHVIWRLRDHSLYGVLDG